MFSTNPGSRPEAFAQRNFMRNLIAQAVNQMFPGSQRNHTIRDSDGLRESIDMHSTCTITYITGPIVGSDTAGE